MPRSLIELEATFLKIEDEDRWQTEGVDMGSADGVMFLCPTCFEANGGAVGTHQVVCWRPHVSQEHTPRPGRWEFEGSGMHDLTLVAGSSSVFLSGEGGCQAHFFVRRGQIEMCG
jgi:hypothetical protein